MGFPSPPFVHSELLLKIFVFSVDRLFRFFTISRTYQSQFLDDFVRLSTRSDICFWERAEKIIVQATGTELA